MNETMLSQVALKIIEPPPYDPFDKLIELTFRNVRTSEGRVIDAPRPSTDNGRIL